MPINIQGSGLHLDRNIAMVDDGQYLWIAGSISSMPPSTVSVGSVQTFDPLGSQNVIITNYPTIQKSLVTNGSVWIDSSGGILTGGPRSGLILQNLGPGDVQFNFGSPFTGSNHGFRLSDGTIYEMPDYFLYTGSITLAKIGTGSSNISYMEI